VLVKQQQQQQHLFSSPHTTLSSLQSGSHSLEHNIDDNSDTNNTVIINVESEKCENKSVLI